jgi:chromosome segregation ATPase
MLIKEQGSLKDLCKSHMKTINLLKRELKILNNDILKKDKKIQNLENDTYVVNVQNELENVKNELNKIKVEYVDLQNKYNDIIQKNEEFNKDSQSQKHKSELSKLKSKYNDLKCKYDDVVKTNEELMSIFDYVESTYDSE